MIEALYPHQGFPCSLLWGNIYVVVATELLLFLIDRLLKGQYIVSVYWKTSLARSQTGYCKDGMP